MAYFSNGTEGMIYQTDYCDRCRNYQGGDAPGCPIWDLHLLHQGEVDWQPVLDKLIPRTPDGLGNEQCETFVEEGA